MKTSTATELSVSAALTLTTLVPLCQDTGGIQTLCIQLLHRLVALRTGLSRVESPSRSEVAATFTLIVRDLLSCVLQHRAQSAATRWLKQRPFVEKLNDLNDQLNDIAWSLSPASTLSVGERSDPPAPQTTASAELDGYVELLRIGTDTQKAEAATVLWTIALDRTNAITARAHLVPLAALLVHGSERHKQDAVEALRNLVHDPMTRAPQARVLPDLIQLLCAEDPTAKQEAAWALHEVACGSKESRAIIVSAGAVETLVKMLRGDNSDSEKIVLLAALGALCPLRDGRDRMTAAGGVSLVGAVLDSTSSELQLQAVEILWLVGHNDENRTAIVEAGAIKPLLKLLRKGSSQVKPSALGAVVSLVCSDGEIPIPPRELDALVEARIIPFLVDFEVIKAKDQLLTTSVGRRIVAKFSDEEKYSVAWTSAVVCMARPDDQQKKNQAATALWEHFEHLGGGVPI